jgi:UDP-glucose 4-epimerase
MNSSSHAADVSSDIRVLITGAGGYLGRQLAARLRGFCSVVGIDLRKDPRVPCDFHVMDIRDPSLTAFLGQKQITHVVHLAAVLKDSGDRQRDYDIDVNGSRNVLDACVGAGVRHLTVTSSGAAYGYHPDNPEWIDEEHPLRANDVFAYACHKRRVEEMLADYRERHPALQQLILRSGTILGADTRNLITELFTRKRILAIRGSASPFVFIWDQDVLAIIEKGVLNERTGIYNLAGDGALTLPTMAGLLDKPLWALPASLVRFGLRMGRALGLTEYGADQLDFLRYRPVLSNRRLKEEFGYVPRKTSEQTFRYYLAHARARGEL